MKHYYLFGRTAAQPLIKSIHEACFQQLGLASTHKFVGGVVEPTACHRLLKDQVFAGASLVRPQHRSFSYVPRLGMANRLDSINTIVRQQGYLVAYNTDYVAITNCLDSFLRIKSAVVIGTGSLANTLLQYLLRRNITVTMHNQGKTINPPLNTEQAEYLKWFSGRSDSPDLVVSTSSETLPADLSWLLRGRPVVMDLDSECLNSPLLEQASSAGCSHLISPTEFLIHRTLEQNYLFTGHLLNNQGTRLSILREFLQKKEISRMS